MSYQRWCGICCVQEATTAIAGVMLCVGCEAKAYAIAEDAQKRKTVAA